MMADGTDDRSQVERLQAEVARLNAELGASRGELTTARAEQAATASVLRVIASSPTDPQHALDAILASAAQLGGAEIGWLFREQDGLLHRIASYPSSGGAGTLPALAMAPRRDSVPLRAFVDRCTVNVPDIVALPEDEFALAHEVHRQIGHRSNVGVPLRRGGDVIGVISLARMEVHPFGEAEIALLETFADQAVIAIENARLFETLEQRNTELAEALEQQTATAEVLRVIASSPTDLQTVLDAIAESSARLCEAANAAVFRVVGDTLHNVAGRGQSIAQVGIVLPISRGSMAGRAVVDRKSQYELDLMATRHEFPDSVALLPNTPRTMLSTPLLREGTAIGAIVIYRLEVRPFTDAQVALLETFADQAVIAIENARLFQELEQRNAQLTSALDQQTATAEVLRVIASAPTDLERVLQAIIETAARLCEAPSGALMQIRERDGRLSPRATVGRAREQAR